MNNSTKLVIAATAAFVCYSCADSVSPPTPKSLAFQQDTLTLVADDSLARQATLTLSNGATSVDTLTSYTSSAPTVATVDKHGLIKAIAQGVATITATLGSLHDELALTVNWAPVATVELGNDTLTMIADDSVTLSPTLTNTHSKPATYATPTFNSSNAAIATVSAQGKVKAVAAGSAVIRATSQTATDSVRLTVNWAPKTSVALVEDTLTLVVDDSVGTHVVVLNSHNKPAPNASVTYSTSAPAIATVDQNGKIHAQGVGTVTITATDGALHDDMQVTIAPQFLSISAGDEHTCGITGTHKAYCWGYDGEGNLGVGTLALSCPITGNRCSLIPVPVIGGEQFVSVAAGDMHTCALTAAGVAYCWGANYDGQLGIGTSVDKVSVPTLVAGGLTFKVLHAGRFTTCGITTGNDTYCWGTDNFGQLGAGLVPAAQCPNSLFWKDRPCARSPIKVTGSNVFVDVQPSASNTCAVTSGGTMYCWGKEVGGTETTACEAGQNNDCSRTPLLQAGGATFTSIQVADVFRCGHKSDHTLACMGFDFYGNFGNGTSGVMTTTPVAAAGGATFASFILGASHTCGLSAGTVQCWGNNYAGQVGGTVGTDRLTPGVVAGGITWAWIAAGSISSTNCGVSTAGRAYCWGNGNFGNLGNSAINAGQNASSGRATPVAVNLVR